MAMSERRSISILQTATSCLSPFLRATVQCALVAILLAGCDGGGEPLQADECQVASSCGDRKYCDAQNTSICIRSAEGVNRCGLPPSSCSVKLCSVSADCASLGANYFCDTPNSGCCSDGELPRCVAAAKATP
jgi:hypothetical protein